MSVADTIRDKLTTAFAPTRLDIEDESHRHRGHAGAREGGESHFRIVIVTEAFAGLAPVARQRAVNRALKAELAGPIHALSMETLTPAEAALEEGR